MCGCVLSEYNSAPQACAHSVGTPPPMAEPSTSIPVVDPQTGLFYINHDCATCNGVTFTEALPVTMACGNFFDVINHDTSTTNE